MKLLKGTTVTILLAMASPGTELDRFFDALSDAGADDPR